MASQPWESKGYSSDTPARIYYDGIFDLFHYGHARALEQAKKLRPHVYLMVGGKTVFTDTERYESLRHCKWVDQIIQDAPWIITMDFLEKHSIDYVSHDDIPYASKGIKDVYHEVKLQGRFLATQRTEGVSTSEIITRIVRDYDDYLVRNLDRGVSPKELNIGFLKERQVRIKRYVEGWKFKLKESLKASEGEIKHNWFESKEEFVRALKALEEKSQKLIHDFTRRYSDAVVLQHLIIGKTPRKQNIQSIRLINHQPPPPLSSPHLRTQLQKTR